MTCSVCGRPFTPTPDNDVLDPDSARTCPACRYRGELTELMTSDELTSWLMVFFRQLITGQVELGVSTAAGGPGTMTDIGKAALGDERPH